ncbi:MAG: hypothetical protein JSV93_02515 [Candidatus Omnitrophota bacterium]|nr:MAG: hypothetical protein JSV93_02515 [Candidatus Omnitrophota bacterium]
MTRIKDALSKHFDFSGGVDGSVQEELAKTFFASSTKTDRRRKKAPKAVWVISVLTLLLASFLVLILGNHIEISIKIKDKSPGPVLAQQSIFFMKDGEPGAYPIGDMYFFGDAHKFSRQQDNMLVLINSRGRGWANFSVELNEPVDMKRFNILSYVAKGEVGDEYLIPVLIDADDKSYRVPRDFSLPLTKEWQEYMINLSPARNKIDLSRISIIRFEFGSLSVGNYPTATMFLKDISVKKP